MISKYIAVISMVVLVSCVEHPTASKGGIATRTTSGPDPLAPYMWHLNPVTVPYISGAVITSSESHINLADLHNTYQGKGVTIVVSDEHAQMDHPDLSRNADLARSKNYITKIGSTYVTKSIGPYFGNPYFPELHSKTHGTNVAGAALAGKNNGTGGFGVAPQAKLVNYNFLLATPSTSVAIDQLKIQGGNSVFNYSYGNRQTEFTPRNHDIVSELSHNAIYENNIYVKSSGNDYIVDIPPASGGGVCLGNSNFEQGNASPFYIMV